MTNLGWLLRKNSRGEFVLQLYTKGDPFPPIEREGALIFDSLEDAVNEFARQGLIRTVDNGIKLEIDTVTYSPYSRVKPVLNREALFIW